MLVNFQTDCWAGPNTGKLTWVNFLPTLKNRILKMATPGSLACFLSTPRLSRRLVISYSMYVWIILREGSRHDVRVWHSWKGHKWISEYIRIKKFTRTNIRIYSYQQIWHEQMPELVFVLKIVWIFEYSSSFYTDQRMSEYICANKFDTNECANIFIIFFMRTNVRIYISDQYIWIFEYSNIFATLWFTSMDRSAHPFIHSSIHVLEIFFSEHKQNTTEDTTQVHHRKNKVFETVTRDIEARARKERDEPRKMVSPIHQFTYPPTHLLTQSPIHPTSPHLTHF